MSVWSFYKKLKKEYSGRFPDDLANCQVVIENLWTIKRFIDRDFVRYTKEKHEELEPYEQYISLFFQRNISYLIASFKLTRQGLVNPSYCTLRTVYEQVLRSVLFYYFHDEAQLLYDFQNEVDKVDPAKKEELRKKISSSPRRYWSHQYMIDKLFEKEIKEGHKNYYETLSWYSHPTIKSAFNDFFVTKSVEDLTKVIQDLCFNSLGIFQKTFNKILNSESTRFIKDTQTIIGTHIKEVGVYEPNKTI